MELITDETVKQQKQANENPYETSQSDFQDLRKFNIYCLIKNDNIVLHI